MRNEKTTVIKNIWHNIGTEFVGLSMMCYKNQKTSPLDKNELK